MIIARALLAAALSYDFVKVRLQLYQKKLKMQEVEPTQAWIKYLIQVLKSSIDQNC